MKTTLFNVTFIKWVGDRLNETLYSRNVLADNPREAANTVRKTLYRGEIDLEIVSVSLIATVDHIAEDEVLPFPTLYTGESDDGNGGN